MQSFEVRGGKKLFGEITPQGAKNEALQIISAVLLTAEKVTIKNILHLHYPPEKYRCPGSPFPFLHSFLPINQLKDLRQ